MSNIMVRAARFVGRTIVRKGLFLVSLLIPSEKGLVVFSMSRGRYWGNSQALFEFMAEANSSETKIIWLADPALSREKIPERYKNNVVPRQSLHGWYTCARAELAVISHSFGDFGWLREVVKRKKVVMLWHAITTKHCGVLDEKLDARRRKRYRKNEAGYYDRLISSSDIDRYYSASYTGMDVNAVDVTGLPRNDRLFRAQRAEKGRDTRFSILYAPTFRDYPVDEGSMFFPFSHDVDIIAEWARKKNIEFYLRPHPNDQKSVGHVRALIEGNSDVFKDAGVAEAGDVTALILSCDAIVTDYSSIYIDGLVVDSPVTFVDLDRERYMEKRGLAYEYDLITPGPKVRNWPDFRGACGEMADGSEEWWEQRDFVRQMFFKYRDANACSRVACIIEDMLSRY